MDERPPSHLVLLVHGVGESLFSRGDVGWPSFVECAESVRSVGWDLCSSADGAGDKASRGGAAGPCGPRGGGGRGRGTVGAPLCCGLLDRGGAQVSDGVCAGV